MSIIRFHTASDERPNDHTITAALAVADSTEIDIADFAGGGIAVGTLTNQTTLTYYVATKPGGTYKALYGRTAAAVTQAIDDDRAFPLPDEIYGFGALKIVVDGTALPVTVSLKG